MTSYRFRICDGLSGNQLKLIAAISMLIDHAGFLLFPDIKVLRVLGRIAFPIYAYMIAEGCRYTKNKPRYFGTMFFLASIYQMVYFWFDGSTYMCILITFSLSILVIYALQYFKYSICLHGAILKKVVSGLLLFAVIATVYLLNQILTIDYGFWGSMTPVLVSVFQQPSNSTQGVLYKFDRIAVHVMMLGIGLCFLGVAYGRVQYFAFAAIPLLLCYSGRRGEHTLKCFFYVFYPAHLVFLQCIHMLQSVCRLANNHTAILQIAVL